MEAERVRIHSQQSQPFIQTVKKAKGGDKESMEEILNLFKDDIEHLSRFIKLPREEVIQELKIELITIICEKL
jgi:DNA-directed RNA polymerase subunit F